jgi:hypothetical protein
MDPPAAAAEAELQTLRSAAARAEAELRAQLSDCRVARDAEVAGQAAKLEQALSACDKAVAEAEQMLAGKDGLLAEWKKEAELVGWLSGERHHGNTSHPGHRETVTLPQSCFGPCQLLPCSQGTFQRPI